MNLEPLIKLIELNYLVGSLHSLLNKKVADQHKNLTVTILATPSLVSLSFTSPLLFM